MTNKSAIYTTDSLLNAVQFSHATLYRLIELGVFPKPFKIGLRKNAWFRADIESWIVARAEDVAGYEKTYVPTD